MTCPTKSGHPTCFTCALAGLSRCPNDGAPLLLVANERPKVIYRGSIWWNDDAQNVTWTRQSDPKKW